MYSEKIAEGVQSALESDLAAHVQPTADSFELRVRYVKHGDAFKTSWYPGAHLVDSQTVSFSSSDCMLQNGSGSFEDTFSPLLGNRIGCDDCIKFSIAVLLVPPPLADWDIATFMRFL